MNKILFSILLALVILLLYKSTVFAQSLSPIHSPEGLQVSPAIEELSISPGKTASYTLTLTNTADRPVGIHADVTIFQTSDEEKESLTIDSPLISWTGVDPTDLLLGPGEKKEITVTIHPPSSLKEGGYYAAIYLTPFISQQKKPQAPIILTRIGTLLLAQYGQIDYTRLKDKTHIQEFGFDKWVFEESPFDFHFHVTNSYFTHFTAKPTLTLTPLFGASQKIQLSEKHILPGKSKVWHEEISPKTTSLFYAAHLAVSVGAGNYIYADSFVVIIPYLHYILSGLALLILVLIATFHKRARKAIQILFKG